MTTKQARANEPAQAPATTTPGGKLCGCLTGTGEQCLHPTQKVFAQGHDARMSSRLAKAVAAGAITADDAEALIRKAGGGDLLVSKTRHSADLRTRVGNGDKPKVTKAKGVKAGDDLAAKVSSAPSVLGRQVEVFHGESKSTAVVVRDATTALVARHRVQGKNCDHEVEVETNDGETTVFTK